MGWKICPLTCCSLLTRQINSFVSFTENTCGKHKIILGFFLLCRWLLHGRWKDFPISVLVSSFYLPLSFFFAFTVSGWYDTAHQTWQKIYQHTLPHAQNKRAIFSCTLSLLTGAIVFTLLALSPTATVLDHTLYHIAYPDTIYQLLSVFRSRGD